MADKASIDAVQNILGNPVDASFCDNALKIRRNLLVCSVAVFLATLGKVTVDQELSVFGLKFIGLTTELIRLGLVATTAYLLLHFTWFVFEALTEWRLRVTGTRLAFLTGAKWGGAEGDSPDDPRQSTLYSWWVTQAHEIGNLASVIKTLDELRKNADTTINSLNSAEGCRTELNALQQLLKKLDKSVFELSQKVDAARVAVQSNRIPVSLGRFDQWFSMFLRSQNLCWLLIEAILPLASGVASLFLLLDCCH